ncbi:MAG: SiaB family protein kinase [Flammeovirgaceae bacterium]
MIDAYTSYHYYNELRNKDILISYKGAMSSAIITEVCKEIESFWGENNLLGKKIYNIFVELAQNISYYSVEKDVVGNEIIGKGYCIIEQQDDSVHLIACNVVENETIKILDEKCKLINSLDRPSLRKLKFNQREFPNNEKNSRGAGVGLIQVALIAENNINSLFLEIDKDYSLFRLSVNIQKT